MRLGIYYKEDSQNKSFFEWRRIKDDVNQLIYTLHFIREKIPEWENSLMRRIERFQEVWAPFKLFKLTLIHNANEKRTIEIVVYSDDGDTNPKTMDELLILMLVIAIFDGHYEYLRVALENSLINSETASKFLQDKIIKLPKDIASRRGPTVTEIYTILINRNNDGKVE